MDLILKFDKYNIVGLEIPYKIKLYYKLEEIYDTYNDYKYYFPNLYYKLDELVNHDLAIIRIEVAKQGYELDKLINDKDWMVRAEVAKQGYGLDKLINDEFYLVRQEVAKQGYRLDKLIKEEEFSIKEELYENQKYGRQYLIKNDNYFWEKNIMEELYKRMRKSNLHYKDI